MKILDSLFGKKPMDLAFKAQCVLVRVVEVLHYLDDYPERVALVHDSLNGDIFTVCTSKIMLRKSRGKDILVVAQEIH